MFKCLSLSFPANANELDGRRISSYFEVGLDLSSYLSSYLSSLYFLLIIGANSVSIKVAHFIATIVSLLVLVTSNK